MDAIDNTNIEKDILKQEFWSSVESLLTLKEYEIIHLMFVEGKTRYFINKETGIAFKEIDTLKESALLKLQALDKDYLEVLA